MERARPSSLRSFSRNSRTSRPRSPISATTLMSASERRAIIPKSVDFPTPLPAKIPTRWPRPSGVKLSMARTPVMSGCWIRARDKGLGTAPSPVEAIHWRGRPLSRGLPKASMTLPESPEARGTRRRWGLVRTSSPGHNPSIVSRGIRIRF